MSQNYSDAQMQAHLMQARCKRFSYEGAPGWADAEMTVFWEVSDNKSAEAVSFLDRFGCGDNFAANPHLPTQLIADPVVSHEPYAGKWRVVRSWYDPQLPGMVFQSRRRGFLSSLLASGDPPVVDWSEARMLSGRDHLVFAAPVAGQTDDFVVIQWRNIAPRSAVVMAGQLVGLGTGTAPGFWSPMGQGGLPGEGWRILPPTWEVAQDGSEVLSVAFVKLGVTIKEYNGLGSEIASETETESVTEDQMQHRIEQLKMAADVVNVSGSRDRQSGLAQVRYTKLTPNQGVFYYSVTTEEGSTEYHKVAWEQVASGDTIDLNWNGSDFPNPSPAPPGVPVMAHLQRRVNSVRRNPQTGRWSYHVVVFDGGTQLPLFPSSPLSSYRLRFEERRMWSIANNMYWDQQRIRCYAHQLLVFVSFAEANAWIGGNSPTPPTSYVNGVPIWSGGDPVNHVDEGAPQPRLIGRNRWLAQRRVLEWASGWFPEEPV